MNVAYVIGVSEEEMHARIRTNIDYYDVNEVVGISNESKIDVANTLKIDQTRQDLILNIRYLDSMRNHLKRTREELHIELLNLNDCKIKCKLN